MNETHHSPENAFQFMYHIRILWFQSVLSDVPREIRNVPGFVKNPTSKISLCKFTIEMGWNSIVKIPALIVVHHETVVTTTDGKARVWTIETDAPEGSREMDFHLDHVMIVALLGSGQ
jgi:hypothetical protein